MKIFAVKLKSEKLNIPKNRAWYTDGQNYFYGTDNLWGNSVIYMLKVKDYKPGLKEDCLRKMEQFRKMRTLPIHELFLKY